MPKEKHPYIQEYFDDTRAWEYLIIGTFPPNKELREGKKSLTDYFYGNKGSLWKIMGKIYTEFNFEIGTRSELIDKMIAWQAKYNIGITDTLKTVSRKDKSSADDADLILDWDDYNHELKEYILKYKDSIKKIIFTSNKGCNSAFGTFKVLMGNELKSIEERLITDLPSPSGSSNTAWFNVNKDATFGLHKDLYNYILTQRNQEIDFFRDRWNKKKIKKETKSKELLPSTPAGLVNDFKVWSYKKVLPKQIN